MGLSPKFSKQKIDKVKKMRANGKPAKYIASQTGLTVNQVNYILFKKDKQKSKKPMPKAQLAKELEPGLNELFGTEQARLDKLYDEADKAVKEADSVLKRVKRLLFGR